MTPKLITYSDHAESRLRERGFTRQDVRALLARGIWQQESSLPGAAPRFSKRGYLGQREARVVYLEDAERVHVVTVEWTDEKPMPKGG